jgi:hypothetical protein
MERARSRRRALPLCRRCRVHLACRRGNPSVLRGKVAIREYWAVGLAKIPDLRFEVVDVYTGLDTVVINYRNHTGGLVNEVLRLGENGLVTRGDGTYLAADAAGASGVQTT